MKAGIIVILHDRAEEAYAGEMAAALSPLPAFPLRLAEDGERAAQIGAGALAIVICSRHTDRAAVQRAVSYAPTSLLICCLGVEPPAEVGGEVVRLVGDAVVDAAMLLPAIAGVQARLDERGAQERSGATPRAAQGARGLAARAVRKEHLAVRSAFGLAATMAVVAAVAPAISARAVAPGGAENEPDATVAAAVQTTAPASPQRPRVEAAVAAPPQAQHALDQWLLADAPSAAPHDDLAAADPAPEHFVEAVGIAEPTLTDSDEGAADALVSGKAPTSVEPAKPAGVAARATPSEGAPKGDAAVRPIK